MSIPPHIAKIEGQYPPVAGIVIHQIRSGECCIERWANSQLESANTFLSRVEAKKQARRNARRMGLPLFNIKESGIMVRVIQ